LKDNPLLTVRLPGGKKFRQPLRVIVDSRLRIPLHSRLVRTAREYPTLVAATQAASLSRRQRLAAANVEVAIITKDVRGHVSLRGLMKELARRGVVSLLLEGGSTLNASALKERVVDRLLFFLAPKIIGGQRAPGVIGGDGTLRIKDAEPVEILKVGRIGPDILIEGALKKHR